MDISVTELKQRCLQVLRLVEHERASVTVRRRGKVIAQLVPAGADTEAMKPWERLRGRGEWLAEPEESFVGEEDIAGM